MPNRLKICARRQGERGHVLAELAAVIPLFLVLIFLSLEYGRFHDDSQRMHYIARELISLGSKWCAVQDTWGEKYNCFRNDLQPKLEAAIRIQSPDRPVLILITPWVYSGDPTGAGTQILNADCRAPFARVGAQGSCATNGEADMRWQATLTPGSTAVSAPGWRLDRNITAVSRFARTQKNLEYMVRNRCERWPTRFTEGWGSCFVVTAEGFVPYKPLTPLGEFFRNITGNSAKKVAPYFGYKPSDTGMSEDMMYLALVF